MSKRLDREAIAELEDRVDLLEYASQTFDFIVRSGSYFCSCPRHEDLTPSLSIKANDNFYRCFSCLSSGKFISWAIDIEGLSFQQAVEKLLAITGGELETVQRNTNVLFFKDLRKQQFREPTKMVERACLDESYLDRYSSESPQELLDYGVSEDVLKKFGVRIDKKMRRWVYPVWDHNGGLLTVKGRTMIPDYKVLGLMKYQNYHKIGTVDYFGGYRESRSSIEETGVVIVLESIKSCMLLHTWGYTNCISCETSSINDEQIALLIQMRLREVIVAFDKDVSLAKIKENTSKLRRFTAVSAVIDKQGLLEEKESPCDKGREVFEKLIENRNRI